MKHLYLLTAASILLAALGLWCHMEDASGTAVAMLAASYVFLYSSQDRSRGDAWRANPLRFTLPLFLLAQLAHCAMCVFSTSDWCPSDFQMPSFGYDAHVAPSACSQYLLFHFPYFLALHLMYSRRDPPRRSAPPRDLDQSRVLLISIPVLLLTSIGFIVTGGQGPVVVDYGLTFVGRVVFLCWMLLSYIAIASRHSNYRIAARTALCVMLGVGLWAVRATGMRYLLAYQLASWAVVWISVNKLSFRRLIGFAPVGFLSIVALVAATDIKTNGGLQQLSIRNALYSLNTMVARYASFHADAVISLSPQLEGYVLQRRDVVVADILGGIPFTGLSAGKPWANDVSFDMGLHQTILHATERTSFFVPLLTSVRYAFGIPYATVIAILAGWLHAIVARRCLGHPSREAWILQQAMMLPISLHGLARGDLFRPLVNTWLCALLLRVTLASSPQRVHARRREYSSQAATR